MFLSFSARILRTKRGKPLLQIQGFRFNCKHNAGPKTYWSCNKAPLGCKMSIVTFENEIIKIRNSHNHS